jgi:hypothetical protein
VRAADSLVVVVRVESTEGSSSDGLGEWQVKFDDFMGKYGVTSTNHY